MTKKIKRAVVLALIAIGLLVGACGVEGGCRNGYTASGSSC